MSRTTRTPSKGLIALALLLAAFGCARKSPQQPVEAQRLNPQAATTKKTDAKSRPQIYPYSIVPGGIHSVQEFDRKPDLVAQKHYAGLQAIRMVTNSKAGSWYVSYRKGNAIFWTRRSLRIPAGEELVQLKGSDRTPFARARCGNLLSKLRQGPNLPDSEEQPLMTEADLPVPAVPIDFKISPVFPATPPVAALFGDLDSPETGARTALSSNDDPAHNPSDRASQPGATAGFDSWGGIGADGFGGPGGVFRRTGSSGNTKNTGGARGTGNTGGPGTTGTIGGGSTTDNTGGGGTTPGQPNETVVPEPAECWLVAAGVAFLALWFIRRRSYSR